MRIIRMSDGSTSKGGREAAQNTHRYGIAGVDNGCVAAIGSGIDAYGAGRHLRDGHNVSKFACRHPVPMVHHLTLDERQHAVASTETEYSDFKKRDEQV